MCKRVSNIIKVIGPDHLQHVTGSENPADCTFRGLFPSQLLKHDLCWNGPDWLQSQSSDWRSVDQATTSPNTEENREVFFPILVQEKVPFIAVDCYSSFFRLTRVTAWIHRFTHNCLAKVKGQPTESSPHLLMQELQMAKVYILVSHHPGATSQTGVLSAP